MIANKFSDKIKEALKMNLPGYAAQIKMSPKGRVNNLEQMPKDVKKSAVMLLFFLEKNKFHLIFIRRAEDGGSHSGQIGFPGGGFENNDVNLIETAKRETFEEIGIGNVNVLGLLTPIYIPVSNYFVQPVLGFLEEKPKFTLNNDEVSKIHSVNITELLNSKIILKTFEIHKQKIEAPFYIFDDFELWGATAMILSELIEILKNTDNN